MATTNKIIVVEKTPGTHIDYALSSGKKITFGDDELTINLATRERDYEVSLDICIDEEDGVVIGRSTLHKLSYPPEDMTL